MQTEKLYETDSHLVSCEATVLACTPMGEHFGVLLDRTVFFPEGGGQPGDRGFLDDIPVLDTIEKDGLIRHLTKEPLREGQAVRASLDWALRFDRMQQHTGEHILSYALWKLTGAQNVGFHLGAKISTIDLDRPLAEEDLFRAEDMANREVFENRRVLIYRIPPEALASFPARKKADKAAGDPRIVEVEGGDKCTCCATHVKTTGEVGLIKIVRFYPYKQGLRVEFLCGGRALADYRLKNSLLQKAGALLSAKEEDVPDGIRRLHNEIRELKLRLKTASASLMAHKAAELRQNRLLSGAESAVLFCGDLTADEAKMLLNELLSEKTAALVLYRDEGRMFFLLGKTKDSTADLDSLAGLLRSLLGARGGGTPFYRQGSLSINTMPSEETQDILRRALLDCLAAGQA